MSLCLMSHVFKSKIYAFFGGGKEEDEGEVRFLISREKKRLGLITPCLSEQTYQVLIKHSKTY